MAVCYMLVGVPGSGKSTYIEKLKSEQLNISSVSSDEYIEKIAHEQSKTYSEVHREHIKDATKWMNETISNLIKNNKDFIWDQTNLNKKSRSGKIQTLIKAKYEIVAITFEVNQEVILQRISERGRLTGKHIPKNLIESMTQSYERPSFDEGFSSIYITDGFGELSPINNSLKQNIKI